MALIKCAECSREISDAAKACPGCGAPLGGEKSTLDQKATRSQIGCGCLAVFIGLFVVVGLFGNSKPASDDTDIDACVMAQDFVKDRLKAPATADFSSCSDGSATKNGETWTVTGYVDSQNGFGAKLRSRYIAIMTHQPGDKNWHAKSVLIN